MNGSTCRIEQVTRRENNWPPLLFKVGAISLENGFRFVLLIDPWEMVVLVLWITFSRVLYKYSG